MDSRIWGSGCWTFIHCTAAASVTAQQRRDFVTLMEAMALTLPCDKCKQHFRANMRINNIQNYLKNEETLFMWTYLMHDAVNEAQKKTGDQRPSFDEVYKRYFNVVNESDIVDGQYQNKICKEVCASTCNSDTVNESNDGHNNEKVEGRADGAFDSDHDMIEKNSDKNSQKSNSKMNLKNSSKKVFKSNTKKY